MARLLHAPAAPRGQADDKREVKTQKLPKTNFLAVALRLRKRLLTHFHCFGGGIASWGIDPRQRARQRARIYILAQTPTS